MVDCTSDLNDLQANVTRCEYHISIENDPDNWWYSPFDATGLSGSYILPSGGPGSAFDRGSVEFDTFSTNSNIQCSTGSSENWTDANPGKCIDVDGVPKTKLADTQPSASLPQSQCTETNQRWIDFPTAFAPSDSSLTSGQHTHYDMEGCVADCVTPDLNSVAMEEAPTGSGNKSYMNFNQNVKCKDDHGPPAVLGAGTILEDYVSDVGVSAPVCANPGEEYIVQEPCIPNCQIPPDGLSNLGYDMVVTEEAINASPQAKARLGKAHWDPNVIGPLVQCSSGYTKGGDNYFVRECSVSSTNFILNPDPNSDSGCIADCTPDPNSTPYLYDAGGAQSVGLTPVADPPSTNPLPDVPWRDSDSVSFSCPPDYEPGPGAIPAQRPDGSVIYSTPTYQHCGKLLGSTASSPHSHGDGFVETRKNYAVTGCYPICDANTHICLNYSSESDYDVSTPSGQMGDSENTWRTEMGSRLAENTSNQLGDNNISYVRRQVTNERDPATSDGKEIYEWQFKCSTTDCTMDSGMPGEEAKIDLQSLLGDDGIPSAPLTAWHVGQSGEDCNETCAAAGNPGCDTGDWGDTTTSGLFRVPEVAAALAEYTSPDLGDGINCVPYGRASDFVNSDDSVIQAMAGAGPYVGTNRDPGGGYACKYSRVDTPPTCDARMSEPYSRGGARRLCKCEVP